MTSITRISSTGQPHQVNAKINAKINAKVNAKIAAMFGVLLALGLALGLGAASGPAHATDQTRPALDVLVADTGGDLDGFLDRMKRIEGVAERLGLDARLRVFQATFAGPRAGEVHVYWELPSFIAFAEAETALHADPEFLAILAEMAAAGQDFSSELLSIEITR